MNEINSQYFIGTDNLLKIRNINTTQKLLMMKLEALANVKGYAFCSNKYLSDLFDISEEQVTRNIKDLEKKKYIEIKYVARKRRLIYLTEFYKECLKNVAEHQLMSISIDTNVNNIIDENINSRLDVNINSNNKKKSINNKVVNNKEYMYIFDDVNDVEIVNVKITEDEYNKLINKFGTDKVKSTIFDLDNYLIDHPKKYKDHYRTLISWINRDNKNYYKKQNYKTNEQAIFKALEKA